MHIAAALLALPGAELGPSAQAVPPDKSVYNLGNPTPRHLMRPLSADRPDTTESAYTVDAGHAQIELSFVDYTYDHRNDAGQTVHSVAVAPLLLKLGLLNNVDRPPVKSADGRVLFAGEALPHFNEVDECAGLDGLITYRLWRELGYAPENTLHDLRWGQHFKGPGVDDYVWVFLISGAAPPAHFVGGYKGTTSERQPAMYFRLGGGTVKGISKPGNIVWSRVFLMDGKLHCDLGVADVVTLPAEETERRWRETTPQWPIMHAVLKGITRDQMMARHKSNHIQVVYAQNVKAAHRACRIKAAALAELGITVHFCGEVNLV